MMILPIDELNNLKTKYRQQNKLTDYEIADIIDDLLDIFLLAVANGAISINEQFGTDYRPTAEQVEKTIYEKIDGATWEDRVRTWYENGGTFEDIIRIAETESHRIGNEIAYMGAKAVGAKNKTWICQMLPTSRDSHVYLNGTTVALNDYFYSYRGGKTLYPGQFGEAEEDCNCLCELSFS